jgi:hypothetical protein
MGMICIPWHVLGTVELFEVATGDSFEKTTLVQVCSMTSPCLGHSCHIQCRQHEQSLFFSIHFNFKKFVPLIVLINAKKLVCFQTKMWFLWQYMLNYYLQVTSASQFAPCV